MSAFSATSLSILICRREGILAQGCGGHSGVRRVKATGKQHLSPPAACKKPSTAPPCRLQSQPALRKGGHPTQPEGVVMASRCESPPLVPGVHTSAQALMSQLASQPAAQNGVCARRNLCCFLHHGRHSRLSGAPETILPPLSLTLFHHP